MKSTTLFAYGKINVDAIRICISNEFKPKCVRCSIETRPKQKWYTQHHFDTFYSRENRYQSLIIWAASWERRPKKTMSLFVGSLWRMWNMFNNCIWFICNHQQGNQLCNQQSSISTCSSMQFTNHIDKHGELNQWCRHKSQTNDVKWNWYW